MNKKDVLDRIQELAMIYENNTLSHPSWYIPSDKKHLISIHERIFNGKSEIKLTLNEVAALLLENNLIELD